MNPTPFEELPMNTLVYRRSVLFALAWLVALAAALPAGLLRYLGGSNHRTAGYYPPDPERAAELAHQAKRGASKGGDHA